MSEKFVLDDHISSESSISGLGNTAVLVVPAGEVWQVLSIEIVAQLVAGIANRMLEVQIATTGGVFITFKGPYPGAAGASFGFAYFSQGSPGKITDVPTALAGGTTLYGEGAIPPLFMLPGDTISALDALAAPAADQFNIIAPSLRRPISGFV